jgi:quercetin dioxygenase-like cupin family protein
MKPGVIMYRILCLLLVLLLHGKVLLGEEYRNVEVKKVVTSTRASNGQRLSYLRSKHPEVTVLVVTVPPGGSTGWHKHPVPVYAYMLDGALTVELKNGSKYEFKKGDAILEVVNTLHNGYNQGSDPASLVVFYTGAVGVPNVVKEKTAAVPALP